MKRYAERAALALRAASLVAAVALASLPAQAGDRALIDFVGFSPDGAYFAFEEFGIQDGSGFPYSTLYVLDLAQDRWVEGTPVQTRIDDEGATLAAAREETQHSAAALLTDLDIAVPVEILALNGDGAAEANFLRLRFGMPGYGQSQPRSDGILTLESHPVVSPLPCADWFSTPPLGFSLTLTTDGQSQALHRDDRLPRSRGCAVEYRLYGVVQPAWAQDTAAAVAIISVYSGGFEGPDRRFIAVPLGR